MASPHLSALLLLLSASLGASSKRKILALHGGGGSANSMSSNTADLRTALGSDYEFVYASMTGNDNKEENWWADPPGGKDEPTTDRDWAANMVAALDTIVKEQGPFYGIIGYSQGAAAVPVYLAQTAASTFQMAVMFCGYIPTTHKGLEARINEESPFHDIPALSWMGTEDAIISNRMSEDQARKFTSPLVLKSEGAGHMPPCQDDGTFEDVLVFFRDPSTTSLPRGVDDATVKSSNGNACGKKDGKDFWVAAFIVVVVIIAVVPCVIVYFCCCRKKAVQEGQQAPQPEP